MSNTIKLRTSSWPSFRHIVQAFPSRSPIPNSFWMGEGFIEARSCENGVNINGVFVNPSMRSKGYGTRYMEGFLSIIDRYNGETYITVKPFGHGDSLSEEQLRNWYQKLGFIQRTGYSPNHMWRPAQQRIAA